MIFILKYTMECKEVSELIFLKLLSDMGKLLQ